MTYIPVAAAGGILVWPDATPRVAIVLLSKRDEWVLPKGKIDPGETALQAAIREVAEETGYAPLAYEFLGTMRYERKGLTKVVNFWHMEPAIAPIRALATDVRAVEWFTLDAAIAQLSRAHEKTFLAQVGPRAMAAATGQTQQPAMV